MSKRAVLTLDMLKIMKEMNEAGEVEKLSTTLQIFIDLADSTTNSPTTEISEKDGIKETVVRTAQGGSFTVMQYEPAEYDAGTTHSMNGRGMGGSDYIRSEDDKQRHIKHIEQTVWLNEDEKQDIIEAIQAVKFL